MLIHVEAVARPFVRVDGTDVLLTSVEIWDGLIVVSGGMIPSAEHLAKADENGRAFTAWIEHGRERQEPRPQFDSVLEFADATIGDDVGTTYESAGSMGDRGTSVWRVVWDFTPGPPPEATRLIITSDDPSTLVDGPIAIDLPRR